MKRRPGWAAPSWWTVPARCGCPSGVPAACASVGLTGPGGDATAATAGATVRFPVSGPATGATATAWVTFCPVGWDGAAVGDGTAATGATAPPVVTAAGPAPTSPPSAALPLYTGLAGAD